MSPKNATKNCAHTGLHHIDDTYYPATIVTVPDN